MEHFAPVYEKSPYYKLTNDINVKFNRDCPYLETNWMDLTSIP